MAKPETVNQLLRSLGLSVTIAAGAGPGCAPDAASTPRDAATPEAHTEDRPIRDMLIDNPPWTPPDAGDAGDVNDAKEAAYEVSPAPDNPPWVPDLGPDLPTDKVFVSENPPWVPPDAGDANKD